MVVCWECEETFLLVWKLEKFGDVNFTNPPLNDIDKRRLWLADVPTVKGAYFEFTLVKALINLGRESSVDFNKILFFIVWALYRP